MAKQDHPKPDRKAALSAKAQRLLAAHDREVARAARA